MDKVFANIIILPMLGYFQLFVIISFFCYYKLFHLNYFWLCDVNVGFFGYWKSFYIMLSLVILGYITILL
jgi:hypothetical protein